MEISVSVRLNGIRVRPSPSCSLLAVTPANTKLEKRFQVSTTRQASKTFRFFTPEPRALKARLRPLAAGFSRSQRLDQRSNSHAHARMTLSPAFISRTATTDATLPCEQ